MSAVTSAPDPVRLTHTAPSTHPVVVACDGEPASTEALFAAARLAGRVTAGPIEVLGVCEPTPALGAGAEIAAPPLDFDTIRRETLLADIHRVISVSRGGDVAWPVDVKVGVPSRTLATEAASREASILVMGIGRHNPIDRLFGTETTLATVRESSVPVLAVGARFSDAPRRAIVGMDFGPACLTAARLAVQFVGPAGHVTLVHVRPRFEHPSADWQTWDVEYSRTLPPLFEQIVQQLDAPPSLTLDTVVVRGDPAPTLLAYAEQTHADLIAVGTTHHRLFERLMVGSVATRVMRTARCAVLAVPGPPAAVV